MSFRPFLQVGNVGKKFVLELHVKVQFDNAVFLKPASPDSLVTVASTFPCCAQAVPPCAQLCMFVTAVSEPGLGAANSALK